MLPRVIWLLDHCRTVRVGSLVVLLREVVDYVKVPQCIGEAVAVRRMSLFGREAERSAAVRLVLSSSLFDSVHFSTADHCIA